MKTVSSLIEHLKLFEKNREQLVSKSIISPFSRKEYADAIACCFCPCAKKILAGHLIVKNNVEGNKAIVGLWKV